MTVSRPALLVALVAGAAFGLSGCASAPGAPLAAATPVSRPAPPPVSAVAAVLGQRLDAMLAANVTRHP
ncbi:MAG: hypothetical protein ACP5NP_03495 [Acetobacteraceae bacterium]